MTAEEIIARIYGQEVADRFGTKIPVKAINGRVFVAIHDDGTVVGQGILKVPDDVDLGKEYVRHEKHRGIRPRWGFVVVDNPDNPEVRVGDKVLMEMGEWSRSMFVDVGGISLKMWSIPVDKIIGISDPDEHDMMMIDNGEFTKAPQS